MKPVETINSGDGRLIPRLPRQKQKEIVFLKCLISWVPMTTMDTDVQFSLFVSAASRNNIVVWW